jgi:hypothetical protein
LSSLQFTRLGGVYSTPRFDLDELFRVAPNMLEVHLQSLDDAAKASGGRPSWPLRTIVADSANLDTLAWTLRQCPDLEALSIAEFSAKTKFQLPAREEGEDIAAYVPRALGDAFREMTPGEKRFHLAEMAKMGEAALSASLTELHTVHALKNVLASTVGSKVTRLQLDGVNGVAPGALAAALSRIEEPLPLKAFHWNASFDTWGGAVSTADVAAVLAHCPHLKELGVQGAAMERPLWTGGPWPLEALHFSQHGEPAVLGSLLERCPQLKELKVAPDAGWGTVGEALRACATLPPLERIDFRKWGFDRVFDRELDFATIQELLPNCEVLGMDQTVDARPPEPAPVVPAAPAAQMQAPPHTQPHGLAAAIGGVLGLFGL